MLPQHGKTTFGILLVVATAFVFGFYPAATRGAYAAGANLTFIVLFTTFFRALTLSAFCMATGRRLFADRQMTKNATINGFYQTVSMLGILAGMLFMPGPIVITVMFSYTLLLYLFMVLRGEEKLHISVLIPVLVAFIGLALVVDVTGSLNGISAAGVVLALIAAIAIASRVYTYGKHVQQSDPAIVGAEAYCITLLLTLLLVFYELPVAPTTPEGWLWAGVCAASLSLGNFGVFYGIALLGSFRFAFYIKLEPVFGAILSYLLISEVLQPGQYVGIGLVVSSLAVYQLIESRRNKTAAA